MNTSIILRKFNLNYLSNNPSIFIIGEANSGKSTISKDILHHFYDIPTGIVVSATNRQKPSFDCIPPIFVYDSYEKSVIKRFVKKRENIIFNSTLDSRAFIIFENCLMKSKHIDKILKGHRVLNYIVIIESPNPLSTNAQCDYLFLTKNDAYLNRRKIYEIFRDSLRIEYSLFEKLMNDYTSNYHFLVIDLKSNSPILEDRIYWYRAFLHPNARYCSKEAWEYNNSNYIVEPPIPKEISLQDHSFFIPLDSTYRNIPR